MIAEGEGEQCELKATLPCNLEEGKNRDVRMERAALKTITRLLNKRGGRLLIGVSNSGKVLGTDYEGLRGSGSYGVHLKNPITRSMKGAMDYSQYRMVPRQGEDVFVVRCERSKHPVFYRCLAFDNTTGRLIGGEVEEFYVGGARKPTACR